MSVVDGQGTFSPFPVGDFPLGDLPAKDFLFPLVLLGGELRLFLLESGRVVPSGASVGVSFIESRRVQTGSESF